MRISRTPEQREADLQKARDLLDHGQQPAGPIAVGSIPTDSAFVEDEDFDADRDLADICAPAAVRTRLNGKWLWVHGVSPEETLWLNARAQEDLEAAKLESAYERTLYFRLRAQCYQVIAVCRRGPEPGSGQVFQPKHIDILFRNRNPGQEAIAHLCRISDRITSTVDQELPEVVLDFFGRVAALLRTCASGLSTRSSPAWQQVLAAGADCVSRITLQRRLSPSDLEDWPQPPPADPE